MKNYIADAPNNFYLSRPNPKPLLLPSKETHTTTKISAEVIGVLGDKKICLKTGYKEDDKYDNVFILSIEDLNAIIDTLSSVSKLYDWYNINAEDFELMRGELQRYLNCNYIESLTLTLVSLPDGFEPSLYKAFEVKPKFKHDLDPEAGVNLGFRYVHVLHLDIDESRYNATLDELRFSHTEIPINFVGYDRFKEVNKYIERARKELTNFDLAKAAKDRAKNISVLRQSGLFPGYLNNKK